MANYRNPSHYARLIPQSHSSPLTQRTVGPIDLIKIRSSSRKLGVSRAASLPSQTTGIWPWWTYESLDVPGLGKAMLNVGTLNLLVQADDVDVPAGGLDLAFRRIYNSQSRHDANNNDNSTPSVYGNRWTNTLDVHLAWISTGQNSGTVSVYTAEGARDDYTCQTNVVATCTTVTPGVYDILAPTDIVSGIACEYQWTRKSGTSYIFNAPYAACGSQAGQYGRLTYIYSRNSLLYVHLAYSWVNNDPSNPENLAQIVATHMPDGTQLTLNFGQISGTTITELMSLVRPDGNVLDYQYSSTGELTGVDKPGNSPILVGETLPTQWPNGAQIPSGNVPELYEVQQTSLAEVCGPRAAITILGNYMNDGACIDFDYSSNEVDWWSRGVLNPTPQDGVETPSPIQNDQRTGFVAGWNTSAFISYVTTSCPAPGTATELSDTYGHDTVWCYDSSQRVIQTSTEASATDTLTTSAKWDADNNLVETTDARGNPTDMAYDSNGNILEMSLPSQQTSVGTIRPTSLYDYDAYNNVVNYCDPANNPNNGWRPSPSPSPCANSGATSYAQITYSSDPHQTPDPNEPYGCVIDTYTPSNYQTSISYGGSNASPCNNGLPTETKGQTITQVDNTNRTPTQKFGYDQVGNLTSYNPGNGAWTLTYSSDGMERLRSRADPDGVTSYWCYHQDGSVLYSETAYQHELDSSPAGCIGIGGQGPPPFSVSYGYDADGDVATEAQHHNCAGAGCSANVNITSWCTPSVTNTAGTTCKYYDGLDRLVEVKQPYDSINDVYVNPWMTRYWYDLSGDQIKWQGQTFYAYGNLFKTQEMLPTTATITVTSLAAGTIANPTYTAVKATAFDGMDRPVSKYSFSNVNGSEELNTETLTWDVSPIPTAGSNVAGLLGEDCNDATPQQCQEFNYSPNEQEHLFASSDGSSPGRTYVYDPDGRVWQITSTAYNGPQQYTYGVDGRLQTTTDPSDPSLSSAATITHHYYGDGTEKSLDVSSSALTQSGLFSYSYRDDARLKKYVIDDTSLGNTIKNPGQTTITYSYSSAGRLTERTETGVAAYGPSTTIGYDQTTGLENSKALPSGTSLSQFSYSAESELLAVQASAGGTCGSANYTYSLRGEMVNWPDCTNYYGAHAYMANGASLQPGQPQRQEYTWDDLMAVPLVNEAWCTQTCNAWSWNYDAAGRMNLEDGPLTGGSSVFTRRCFDAENHLIATVVVSGACGSQTTGAVTNWGPNGHPITIATYDGNSNLHTETLHWSKDQVLFTTRKVNGAVTLDDIKVDVQGDILPNDGGYSGLTFFDSAPGGTVAGCHNAGGANFAGLADSWSRGFHSGQLWSTPCTLNAATAMPTSIQWYGTYYNSAPGTPALGQGGSLGMPRTDGLTDGYDSIQGVRSYDSNAGNWTTPDAYAGVVHSPTSQKGYIWNGNDPEAYTDPSGYVTYIGNAWINGWVLGPIQSIHAFVQVMEGGMDVTIEYGPSKPPLDGIIQRDTTYGTSIVSPEKYGPMQLVSVNGLSGTALDYKVLSVFSEIDNYLSKAELSYGEFNSNSVIASGLLMVGATPQEVRGLVKGPGAGGGDATTQGQKLAQMVENDIDPATGLKYSFESNAAQADSFDHAGETWVY